MATSDSHPEFGVYVPNVTLAVARGASANALTIPAYYIPATLKFISWDAPVLAHTGVDIDYKMTAYDWYDRALTWSVTGPTGMTIDADGTLHWTPTTDMASHTVTVTCSLGGQETLSKTFTVAVDNSRCVFVSPAGADTNSGTLSSPFLTLGAASLAIQNATNARTIYSRAGTYNVSWVNWDGNATYASLYNKDWSETEPLLVRNYPGEAVKYQTTNGHGFRTYKSWRIFYGMWFSGATIGENAGCLIGGRSVAKRMRVSDSNWSVNNNCTGFKVLPGAILDQCQAWDNYDRSNSGFHNNSDYLYYAYGGVAGYNAYTIDCLSDALGTKNSATGFKIKHAGGQPPHFHKCASLGAGEGFSGMCNKLTIRHSVFTTEGGEALNHGHTDGSRAGGEYANEGFLVEHCVALAKGSGSKVFEFSWWLKSPGSVTPPLYASNDLINVNSTGANNIFRFGQYPSDPVIANWDIGLTNNRFYTLSPSNSVKVEGVTYALSHLTDKGTDNEVLSSIPSYSFTAAGRSFVISNGEISEV